MITTLQHTSSRPPSGRPLGGVAKAIKDAAALHCTPERCPTLAELAALSGVGYDAARATVQNLQRAGHLCHVRERKVPGRNRPAKEYAPVASEPVDEPTIHQGWVDLGRCVSAWTA